MGNVLNKILPSQMTFLIGSGALVLIFAVLNFTPMVLTHENGILENAQLLALCLASLVFLRNIFQLVGNGQFEQRLALAFCLFMINMPIIGAAREVSFGRMLSMPDAAVSTIKLTMAILWIVMIAVSLWHWWRLGQSRWTGLRRLVIWPSSRCIYLAVLLFALGGAFEHGDFGLSENVFVEEILELIAYLLITYAAYLAVPRSQIG